MRIERVYRWQWMLIGLIGGLLLGSAYRSWTHTDWTAMYNVIGDQDRFEQILLRQDKGQPLFREVTVHPVASEKEQGRGYVVTGRYFDGPYAETGRMLAFEAPTPYPAGSAIDRVSTATGKNFSQRYAALKNPTIRDYLGLIDEAGFVDVQYPWWEIPAVMLLLWSAAGFFAIGVVWPTLVNLLVFGSLFRPREEPGIDLSQVKSSGPVESKAPTDADLRKLAELEAQLEASLSQDAAPTATATATMPSAPAVLSTQPVAPAAEENPDDRHFALKPKDFYPTDHRESHGFTLVELLIVIGIIVLLVGILMPVVTGVRKHSQTVKCASNLRQIGQGLEMYNQTVKALPDVATPAGLSQALIDIRAATEPLFHCPSDSTSALDYSMNPQFAGLPKMSGKAGDMLANETGARHSGHANVLYFDGHVDQAAQ
ncbi:MAG TPA: prepilin-type N-terminal cleavage/methylation domain-containing protein [Tepidisphaeraceae bacterium]|nr:prepilin-type N-terminal cleavage/methylation domain-containing protein [Tepidisphaeraceae bacterium]